MDLISSEKCKNSIDYFGQRLNDWGLPKQADTAKAIAKSIKFQPTVIDLKDDDFGAVLNCAVRYTIGRQTYMPHLVIDFITPLIPHLNNRTLWCFDQDVTNAKWEGGYGNPDIDEPNWMNFLAAVREERVKRGEEPYKSWREDNI